MAVYNSFSCDISHHSSNHFCTLYIIYRKHLYSMEYLTLCKSPSARLRDKLVTFDL